MAIGLSALGFCGLVVLLIAGAIIFLATSDDEVTRPKSATTATTRRPRATTDDGGAATTRRPTTTRRSTTTKRPTTSNAPTTTEAALEWRTFTDPDGHYSIDFPAPQRLSQSTISIEEHEVGVFIYGAVAGGVSYRLEVAELPPGHDFINDQKALESMMDGYVKRNVAAVVTARDASPHAGMPALFVKIATPDSKEDVLSLIAGNRLYVLHAKGKDLSEADWPRFRDSFRIL